MKKISLVVSLALVSVFSNAQQTGGRAGGVEFGIKAGLNLADTKDEAVPTTDTRTGYHVGALAHIHLSPTWALQPEVMYSLQGAEYGEGRNRLNYINVPVLLQYMTPSGFRVETGPQAGVLTGATARRNGVDVDIENEVGGADFSWAFGAGYLTRSGFGVDARYNLGISDNRQGDVIPHDLKNRVWQIGFFYQFRR